MRQQEECAKSSRSGKDVNLAVFVESWSGNSSQTICALNSRKDVKHMVKVTNLEIYSLTATCTGDILSSERKVKFSCPTSSKVTDNRWTDTAEGIESEGGTCCFDHVTLLCTDLSGSERVHTTIWCDWLDKEGSLGPFAFSVTT